MKRKRFGVIGRAIPELREVTKALSGSDPTRRAYTAAWSQAKLGVSDEAAVAALRAEIADIPKNVLNRAISDLDMPRKDYLRDRTYRLLLAARDGGVVAPIDESDRVVFEKEAILGRLPLPEAFQRLVAAEPELQRYEEAALAGNKMQPKALSGLLGPGARSSDPDLQGKIALSLASIYLWGCAKGHSGDRRSYFERMGSSSHVTVHLSQIAD